MLSDKHKEGLQKRFDQLFQREGKESFFMRQTSWNRAIEIGLPDQTTEDFRSMGLRTLYESKVEDAPSQSVIADIDVKDALVFIEGQYSPEKSTKHFPQGVIAKPLEMVGSDFSLFMQNRLRQQIQASKNVFSLVNTALQENGLFLYVAPNTKVDAPIEIVLIYSGEEKYYVPRVQVLVASGSEVSICVKTVHLKEGMGVVNSCIDIALEANAKCRFFEDSQKLENAIVLNHVRATCKRDSEFLAITATEGSKLFNQSFEVELQGEGAEAALKGIWSLRESMRSNTKVLVTHKAPHCRSHQFFKGVVRDKSRSTFDGKIYVHPEAQKTEAYQLNNNLILDSKASSFSKPNLEIFADDVKASHGATIAELNEEELFYLQTRGLCLSEAKRRFVVGFLDAIVRDIPFDFVRKRIREGYVI